MRFSKFEFPCNVKCEEEPLTQYITHLLQVEEILILVPVFDIAVYPLLGKPILELFYLFQMQNWSVIGMDFEFDNENNFPTAQ